MSGRFGTFWTTLDESGLVRKILRSVTPHLNDDNRINVGSVLKVVEEAAAALGLKEISELKTDISNLMTLTPLQVVLEATTGTTSKGADDGKDGPFGILPDILPRLVSSVVMEAVKNGNMNLDILMATMRRDPETAKELWKLFNQERGQVGGADAVYDDISVATHLASTLQAPASTEAALEGLQEAFEKTAGQAGGFGPSPDAPSSDIPAPGLPQDLSMLEGVMAAAAAPAADHAVMVWNRFLSRFDGAYKSLASLFVIVAVMSTLVTAIEKAAEAATVAASTRTRPRKPSLPFAEVFGWMHTIATGAIVVYWVTLVAMKETVRQRQEKAPDDKYTKVHGELEVLIYDTFQLIALLVVVDLQTLGKMLDLLTRGGVGEGEMSEILRAVTDVMPNWYSVMSSVVFCQAYKNLYEALTGYWRETIPPSTSYGGGSSSKASSEGSTAASSQADTRSEDEEDLSSASLSSEAFTDALSTCLDDLEHLCDTGGFQEVQTLPAAVHRRVTASGYHSGGSSSEVSFAAE